MTIRRLAANGRRIMSTARSAVSGDSVFGFGEIFGTRPSLHLSDQQRVQRFWIGQLYAAVFGYWLISVVGISYAVLTWEQPHRGLIAASFATAVIFAAACYVLRFRIVAMRWRLWFFGAWNSSAFAVSAFICVLDGGVTSVLTFFHLLPLIYLASGYPLRMVRICGGISLLSYAVIVVGTTEPLPINIILLQTAGLLVGYLLALSDAANRRRQAQEADHMRKQLEMLATTDDLTGCLNHRAFLEALEREIERAGRYGHNVALLTIDVDHFKRKTSTTLSESITTTAI